MSTQRNGNGNGNGSRAIVTTQTEKLGRVRDLFEKQRSALAALLPKHLPPDKLTRLVLSAAHRTPELLDCSPISLLLAAMQSASLGLEPNTPLQLAYLIPFRNWKTKQKEVQFIPGYRGLINLAIQSGVVKAVGARAAYEGDEFLVRYGLDEDIIHVPRFGTEQGSLIAVYSVAKLASGEKTFDVMDHAQVMRIRKMSKADYGPWVDHFDEMAKKTVIRRHAKTMPMNPERTGHLVRALDAQGRAEEGTNSYGDVFEALPEMEGVAQLEEGGVVGDANVSRGDKLAEKLQESVDANAPREPGSDG